MQDIKRQVVIAIRWLPLVVLGAMLAGLFAFVYTSGQPEVFESTSRLEVQTGQNASDRDFVTAQSFALQYANEVDSRAVVAGAIERLGLDASLTSVQKRIEATVDDQDPLVVTVSARGGDPDAARALGIAVGNEVVQRSKAELITPAVKAADDAIAQTKQSIRLLESRVARLRQKQPKSLEDWAEINDLTGQISALQQDVLSLQPGSRAFVRNLLAWSERPRLPESPVEPRPLYWTLLALVAGGMLAAGIAFVLEYLRTHDKVRDERELEEATGLVSVGTIIEDRRFDRGKPTERLALLRYPKSETAEAYRSMLARIGFASSSARSIMVTSPQDCDSKSIVAANLALAYADAGRNVILVDADYRTPRQQRLFEVSGERGLTSILAYPDTPLGLAVMPTSHPRLSLMPAGPLPGQSAYPLGPPQFNALLRRLLYATDVVVFDSPSITGHLDAAVIAANVEGSLLVVPADSKAGEVIETTNALARAEAEVVGAVIYRRVRKSRRGARVDVAPAPRARAPIADAPDVLPRRIPVSITPSRGPSSEPLRDDQEAFRSRNGPNLRPGGNGRTDGYVGGNTGSPASSGASVPYAVPFNPPGPRNK